MAESEERWGAFIDAVAASGGIAIAPEWRPGVARFLDLAAEMVARLEAVPLGDGHIALDATLNLPEVVR